MVYIKMIFALPNQITLFENREYIYGFRNPILVNIKAENDGLLIFDNKDTPAYKKGMGVGNNIMLKAQKLGETSLSLRLFGIIPIKTMHVDVVPYKEVVACGNTVGVKIKADGILIIGLSDVISVNGKRMIPAKESGLKPGDLILEVNNRHMGSALDLMEEIDKSLGTEISIKYKRGSNYNHTKIVPVISSEDKKYRVGMWVRDNAAGIGTLTFYDPQSKGFGALGHGITDIDTGTIMPVGKGEIIESNILTIKRSTSGNLASSKVYL